MYEKKGRTHLFLILCYFTPFNSFLTCHFSGSNFVLFLLADISPDFSPLVVCILQKCIRLLNSESEAFKLPEKSMISLYEANTLKYLLQNQVKKKKKTGVLA